MIDELDRLVGRKEASALLVSAFDYCHQNDNDDYFSMYAKICENKGTSRWQACWEYIKEAFDGDEKVAWKYFSRANNNDYLLIFIANMFNEDSANVHAFLRQHMTEAKVAKYLEYGGSLVGIEYEPR